MKADVLSDTVCYRGQWSFFGAVVLERCSILHDSQFLLCPTVYREDYTDSSEVQIRSLLEGQRAKFVNLLLHPRVRVQISSYSYLTWRTSAWAISH